MRENPWLDPEKRARIIAGMKRAWEFRRRQAEWRAEIERDLAVAVLWPPDPPHTEDAV